MVSVDGHFTDRLPKAVGGNGLYRTSPMGRGGLREQLFLTGAQRHLPEHQVSALCALKRSEDPKRRGQRGALRQERVRHEPAVPDHVTVR